MRSAAALTNSPSAIRAMRCSTGSSRSGFATRAGVDLGAAAAHRPHRQPVAPHVVEQLSPGRDHDIVARALGGPRQRQYRG